MSAWRGITLLAGGTRQTRFLVGTAVCAKLKEMTRDEMQQTPVHAGVAFHPPFLLALCIAAGFGARWLIPLTFVPTGVSTRVGPVVTTLSLGIFSWAVYAMRSGGASIPTGEPTDAIVVRGPYRFSRNPIYLAMLLLQIGFGIWANSLWFIALAAISGVLLWWGVISREEEYLDQKFGAEYVSYQSRVRRWI